MKIVKKILAICVVLVIVFVLFLCALISLGHWERWNAEPPDRITFSDFSKNRKPLRIHQLKGKAIWLAKSGHTGSGPTAYLFDQDGHLEDWVFSTGEGGSLDEVVIEFVDFGTELSVKEVQKMYQQNKNLGDGTDKDKT